MLLLSPYSNRLWSAEDQAFLTNIADLAGADHPARAEDDVSRAEGRANQQALDVAQARITDLERRNNELLKQMDAVQSGSPRRVSPRRKTWLRYQHAGRNSEGAREAQAGK